MVKNQSTDDKILDANDRVKKDMETIQQKKSARRVVAWICIILLLSIPIFGLVTCYQQQNVKVYIKTDVVESAYCVGSSSMRAQCRVEISDGGRGTFGRLLIEGDAIYTYCYESYDRTKRFECYYSATYSNDWKTE